MQWARENLDNFSVPDSEEDQFNAGLNLLNSDSSDGQDDDF